MYYILGYYLLHDTQRFNTNEFVLVLKLSCFEVEGCLRKKIKCKLVLVFKLSSYHIMFIIHSVICGYSTIILQSLL